MVNYYFISAIILVSVCIVMLWLDIRRLFERYEDCSDGLDILTEEIHDLKTTINQVVNRSEETEKKKKQKNRTMFSK